MVKRISAVPPSKAKALLPPEPVYRLKIALKDIRPPIWRRIEVPGSIRLSSLHDVIQTVMGWLDCHLYEFNIHGQSYGLPDPDYPDDMKNASSVKLSGLGLIQKEKFHYIYDFGDDWLHVVTVEDIFIPEIALAYPVCLKGKRACPPEDCGGPFGYAELLEVLADPLHSEHESMREWVGPFFEPESFSLTLVNALLHPKAHRARKKKEE